MYALDIRTTAGANIMVRLFLADFQKTLERYLTCPEISIRFGVTAKAPTKGQTVKQYFEVVKPGNERVFVGSVGECRQWVERAGREFGIHNLEILGPISSQRWIAQCDFAPDYWENLEIQRLLATVPVEHRGWIMLGIAVGKGEGEGAESWRAWTILYLRSIAEKSQ